MYKIFNNAEELAEYLMSKEIDVTIWRDYFKATPFFDWLWGKCSRKQCIRNLVKNIEEKNFDFPIGFKYEIEYDDCHSTKYIVSFSSYKETIKEKIKELENINNSYYMKINENKEHINKLTNMLKNIDADKVNGN